ncbi:MAG: hypothetical protein RJA11_1036, partial [Bacteroidota bacterium]
MTSNTNIRSMNANVKDSNISLKVASV